MKKIRRINLIDVLNGVNNKILLSEHLIRVEKHLERIKQVAPSKTYRFTEVWYYLTFPDGKVINYRMGGKKFDNYRQLKKYYEGRGYTLKITDETSSSREIRTS